MRMCGERNILGKTCILVYFPPLSMFNFNNLLTFQIREFYSNVFTILMLHFITLSRHGGTGGTGSSVIVLIVPGLKLPINVFPLELNDLHD